MFSVSGRNWEEPKWEKKKWKLGFCTEEVKLLFLNLKYVKVSQSVIRVSGQLACTAAAAVMLMDPDLSGRWSAITEHVSIKEMSPLSRSTLEHSSVQEVSPSFKQPAGPVTDLQSGCSQTRLLNQSHKG